MASPPLRQLALQLAALLCVLTLALPYYGLSGESLPWGPVAGFTGILAGLFAWWSGQPRWWWLIHALFAPLAWLVSRLAIDPGWFLLAFILLLLVFRGAASGQVPLYLSNGATARTLIDLVSTAPPGPGGDRLVVDLGAGLGSVVAPLARALPEDRFLGVENAWLTWWLGHWRCRPLRNVQFQLGSLWDCPLSDAQVVYTFLSPVPMAELWEKARQEMAPGSLFVSNTFEIPGVAPEQVITVNDGRATQLHCYRVPQPEGRP